MNILRSDAKECAAVERLREVIRAKQTELKETREAPYPKAHRDRLLHAELTRIANTHADTRNRFGKVIDPLNSAAHFPVLDWPTVLDLLGVDQVTALIGKRIDRLALPEGLEPGPRSTKMKALEAEIFDLGVQEEVAICALEAKTDVHVLRRVDLDPAAVLAAWERAAA